MRAQLLITTALMVILACLSIPACSSDNPPGPADAAIDAKVSTADAGVDGGTGRDGGVDGGTAADAGT